LSLVSANDRQQFVVVEEITARRMSAVRTPHQLTLFHRRAAYAIPRSVRLSHSAADLGAQLPSAIGTLAACSLAMCGLRNCPRTDVDPPRVELPSAAAYRLAASGAITCLTRDAMLARYMPWPCVRPEFPYNLV